MSDPRERVETEERQAKEPGRHGGHASFAGYLMTNNIRVSINCMAFGIVI